MLIKMLYLNITLISLISTDIFSVVSVLALHTVRIPVLCKLRTHDLLQKCPADSKSGFMGKLPFDDETFFKMPFKMTIINIKCVSSRNVVEGKFCLCTFQILKWRFLTCLGDDVSHNRRNQLQTILFYSI